MEQLADTSSLDVDFTSLRQSIQALQAASMRLDIEKAEAEIGLRGTLRKSWKGQTLRHKACRVICKLANYIGKECKTPEDRKFPDFMFAFNLIRPLHLC